MVSTAPQPARRTAAPPADVHVTGRRIAATAVDGLVIGGFVTVLLTARRQRLGDLAAGTLVVADR